MDLKYAEQQKKFFLERNLKMHQPVQPPKIAWWRDIKNIVVLLSFFGIGSAGALLRYAQDIAWVLTHKSVQTEIQGNNPIILKMVDSIVTLKVTASEKNITNHVDSQTNIIKDVLSDIPGAKKAGEERRRRNRARDDLFGLANSRVP